MKRTILYLDDDSACLRLFQHTFGRDYDVRTATTRAEAHGLLSARQAQIVISDQVMPDIEGTEFLREVAGSYPESYRVLLTGGMTVGNVIGEVSSGIVHLFLTKPWTMQEMHQMLECSILFFESRAGEDYPLTTYGSANDQV